MKISILAAAAAVAIAGSMASMQANAADLDFAPPPPMPIVYDWSGFYIGGHVGWGEANFDGVSDSSELPDDPEFAHFLDDLDPNGIVAGVQGGFNWQINSFVLGIEGDITFTDWDDSQNKSDDVISADVDFLGSVRGKAGFAFDRIMIYGTGGIAFTDATFRLDNDIDDVDSDSGSVDFDDIGFVVGAGGDWAVTDNISVGAVALWYIFDEEHDTSTLTDDSDEGDTAEFEDAFVIRANVNFHF
jgi:outer membrane immunogenic protein